MPLQLDYFYGGEAEQYSFYRIPKVLFTDQSYSTMTMEARVLYGLMLDRMGLSVRNGWMDGCGRVFIFFTLEDAMALMGFGHNKAVRHFKELEDTGLIERKKDPFPEDPSVYDEQSGKNASGDPLGTEKADPVHIAAPKEAA